MPKQPFSEQGERQELTRAAKLFREDAFDQAQAICARLVKRNKRSVDAMQLLGLIAFKKNEWDKATAYYQKCIAIAPHIARFHYLLAKVDTVRGHLEQAVASFDQALRLDPTDQQTIAWKAIALERKGAYAQAKSLLEPYVAAATETAEMAETFARIELAAERPRAAHDLIGRHLAKADLPELQRQVLLFLQARAVEKMGDADQAFEAYERANRSLKAAFDAAAYKKSVDRLLAAYSAENLGRMPRAKVFAGPVPIFIAGMPRSGTTLIEQIIDAHPKAHGAGEITDMERIEWQLPTLIGSSQPYPECVADLTQRDVDQLSRGYLAAIRRTAPAAKVIVNKSLEIYKHIGLIGLLLPQAKIIHCRRDPLDTCLSCFFSHLMPPRFAYACGLASLGIVYRQYERLMRRWQSIPGLDMLEVNYEEMVADQARVSQRIIDFCGLEWDNRCLRFYESGRVAMTLSYDQVRRPMYDSSIGRAKRFEKHLQPLMRALADVAHEPG